MWVQPCRVDCILQKKSLFSAICICFRADCKRRRRTFACVPSLTYEPYLPPIILLPITQYVQLQLDAASKRGIITYSISAQYGSNFLKEMLGVGGGTQLTQSETWSGSFVLSQYVLFCPSLLLPIVMIQIGHERVSNCLQFQYSLRIYLIIFHRDKSPIVTWSTDSCVFH